MRRLLLSLLLSPLIVVAGAALWLFSSLPVIDGHAELPGLTSPVRVERDSWGIPRIVAENERDAAFALGYVHAQDRLFQMEQTRGGGAGRLAAILGARWVKLDRTMRTLGIYRAAEAQIPHLSPETRALLEAYAAGVNAWLETRTRALPLEYYVLRFRPEPWHVADSLVYAKLMALQLSGNYRSELLRAAIADRLGRERMEELYPSVPGGASNNWVVDGSRSASGKPVLANDPHLGFSAPGSFYLARLEWPGNVVTGATAAGIPFVLIGHNRRVAWGFTTTGGDVSDVFIEKLEGGGYLTPDGPQPFEEREEVILVRDDEPEKLRVRETRHGPVISEIYEITTPDHVLALQATFLAHEDRTPDALYRMNRARNADEFVRAVENWHAPQQSMAYADVEGRTGMIAPARIPVRRSGDGWLPTPGWTGQTDWIGFIPFDALPRASGPRIVTANNKIVADDYPWLITRDWDHPYRADRITELLDAEPTQSVEASSRIQEDAMSPMAAELLPLLLQAEAQGDRARAAIETLRAWDYVMRVDAAAPLLFTAWVRELERLLFADALGALFTDYFEFRPVVLRRILERDRPLDKMAEALENALADLSRRYGERMDEWSWGRAHKARFNSPLLSRIPVLGEMLEAEAPMPGGYATVNRGHISLRNEADPFASVHGSVLRFVIDMADPDAARFMIVPGQSGNPLSAHWSDLVEPWRSFQWLTFAGRRPEAQLDLEPR